MTGFAAYAPGAGGESPAQVRLRPATAEDIDAIQRIEVVSGRVESPAGHTDGYRRLRWISARADEACYVVNVRNRASIDLHRRWGFIEVLRAPTLLDAVFDGGVGLLMRAALR